MNHNILWGFHETELLLNNLVNNIINVDVPLLCDWKNCGIISCLYQNKLDVLICMYLSNDLFVKIFECRQAV